MTDLEERKICSLIENKLETSGLTLIHYGQYFRIMSISTDKSLFSFFNIFDLLEWVLTYL